MCGVFGWVSKDGSGPDMDVLRRVAVETERRGPHAFGFAWLDGRGAGATFKQPGRVSENLDRLDMLRNATMLVGHCRFATHGLPEVNRNNHPHKAGNGWIVHNGIFGGHRDVARKFKARLRTDCDSEAIGAAIGAAGGSLVRRVSVAVRAGGYSPLVVLGLWAPDRMVVARMAGQPLHAGGSRHGSYLASLRMGLPGKVVEWPDETILEVGSEGCRTRETIRHPEAGRFLTTADLPNWDQKNFREFRS